MIILNELNYAEQCLKDGAVGDKPFYTMSILAKYYYHHLGYKKKQIVDCLTKFLSENYPRYYDNKADWDMSIETIAANCKKYQLYEIEGIWVTKAEMNSIQAIKNKVLERLTFTLLCLAKLAIRKNGNANGWINEDAKTIFSLARISGSVLDRNIRIGQLAKMGIIELPKKNDSLSVRITIVDDESDNELFVHDFRELGYEYLRYCGDTITPCKVCNILFRNRRKNSWEKCPVCRKDDEDKTITCVDCGKKITVPHDNKRTIRCESCQGNRDKMLKKERNKRYYESHKDN